MYNDTVSIPFNNVAPPRVDPIEFDVAFVDGDEEGIPPPPDDVGAIICRTTSLQ